MLRGLPEGPLHDLYTHAFPVSGSDSRTVSYIALDLETTGLDPRKDEILSIGLVGIEKMEIDMATARHELINPGRDIPEKSAVIHHITDDRAAGGRPLESVLQEILPLMAGKVLIAHHARFELGFLQRACKQLFNAPFLMPVVDTQAVARRRFERRNLAYRANALRLATLREQHGLPRYRLHNALSDAVAAAELFLAQLAQYDTGKPVELKNFLLKV